MPELAAQGGWGGAHSLCSKVSHPPLPDFATSQCYALPVAAVKTRTLRARVADKALPAASLYLVPRTSAVSHPVSLPFE